MDIDVVGVVASNLLLLASVLVITLQVREMTKQTRASTEATRANVYQGITDLVMGIDRLFIDRPELRPYFYDAAPLPFWPERRARVEATAELIVDLMDNVIVQGPQLPDHLVDPWRGYFRDVVASSPAVRAYWRANGYWYCHPTRSFIDECMADWASARRSARD